MPRHSAAGELGMRSCLPFRQSPAPAPCAPVVSAAQAKPDLRPSPLDPGSTARCLHPLRSRRDRPCRNACRARPLAQKARSVRCSCQNLRGLSDPGSGFLNASQAEPSREVARGSDPVRNHSDRKPFPYRAVDCGQSSSRPRRLWSPAQAPEWRHSRQSALPTEKAFPTNWPMP